MFQIVRLFLKRQHGESGCNAHKKNVYLTQYQMYQCFPQIHFGEEKDCVSSFHTNFGAYFLF